MRGDMTYKMKDENSNKKFEADKNMIYIQDPVINSISTYYSYTYTLLPCWKKG